MKPVPWTPGLPQAECTSCELRCVAQTLDDGRCVQCVARGADDVAEVDSAQAALFEAA